MIGRTRSRDSIAHQTRHTGFIWPYKRCGMPHVLLGNIIAIAVAMPASAAQVLFTFSDTADGTTQPFHVDGPWKLQWGEQPGLLMVQLY